MSGFFCLDLKRPQKLNLVLPFPLNLKGDLKEKEGVMSPTIGGPS